MDVSTGLLKYSLALENIVSQATLTSLSSLDSGVLGSLHVQTQA